MSEVSVEALEIENLNLRAELQRVRQVATVFIRVLETFVNDVDACSRRLRNDLGEVSTQVATRNSSPPVVAEEEE